MSEGIIGLETLDDIGEAIQYVEGSETTYTPGAMAEAIRGMKRTLVPKTATSNGVYSPILDDADGYSEFTVQVPGITPTGTVNINQNGTVDVTQYANAAVDVPNSYTAADEGKVVSSGALVAQTARTVITKGTYDTTTNNSVIVDTPDPGEVLAKLGSASQIVKLSGQYGPMVSGTDNYITPVDHYGEIATIDTTEPFEVGIRFKISQAVQAITYVLGAWDYDEDSDVRDLPLLFIGATGKLRYYLYSGSASDPTITQGGFNDMAAQVGTWITLGMAWDGTDMVLTASDGTTTETVTVANFTPVQTSAALPCFGAGGGTEANHLAALAGSYVDIAGCYIKQDGALVWGNENSGGGGGSGAVIQPLTVTQNGTYTPPAGVDGYGPVVVDVEGSVQSSVKLKVGQLDQIFSFPDNAVYGPMLSGGASQYIVPVKADGTEAILDYSQPYEICCTFKLTNALGSYGRNIWGSIADYYSCPTIAAFTNKLAYYATTRSGSWTYNAITITPSSYTTPLNTWIVTKLTWDGEKATFYINDGTIEASQVLEGVTLYYNANSRFCFGSQENSNRYAIAETGAFINMIGTYLKQNGVLLWGKEA